MMVKRILAATTGLLALGAVAFAGSRGVETGPPICEACVGPNNTECWIGLNFGYVDCETVWVMGEQICVDGGTSEDCPGLP